MACKRKLSFKFINTKGDKAIEKVLHDIILQKLIDKAYDFQNKECDNKW